MDGSVLIASQGLVVALSWPLAVAVVVATWQRRSARLWLPALATAALLVSTGLVALRLESPWVGVVWFAAFPILMATYPDGRLVPRWGLVPIVAWLALSLWYVASGGAVADEPWWIYAAASQLALAWFPVYRYRRRLTTGERAQVRWPILGLVIELTAYAVLIAAEGGTVAAHGPLSVAAANLAGWPLPVALAIGLLWPTVADVDRALRVTLLVVLTGAAAAAAYGLVTAALGAWSVGTVPAGWAAAAAAAAVTVPAARGSARAADWLVYGGRASPDRASATLRHRLDAQSSPALVTRTLAEATTEAIRSPGCAVLTTSIPGAHSGSADVADGVDVPLTYQGESLGVVRVLPRRGETGLTARDLRVVTALAAQAAPAVHGAQMLADARAARADQLIAHEEERKRLRRDLHDDLAPTLAGLGMGISAVRERFADAPEDVREIVEDLHDGIRQAMAQTRDLTHGLRPPILDDRGLADAIRARARPLTAAGIEVTLDIREDGEVPAAVELAVLRIVQEAMHNVHKHSRATACAVTVARRAAALEVSVVDDGVGMDAATPRSGLGLDSMRSRAHELGGAAWIGPTPGGGTRVRVRLPLSGAAA